MAILPLSTIDSQYFKGGANLTRADTAGLAALINTLTTRTNEIIQGGLPYINVKSYGAVGDGTTDDAPYIQAAIDALQGGTPGILYFPPGTYRVNTALSLGAIPLHFMGDSFYSTTIKAGAAIGAIFDFADLSQNYYVQFKDLTLDGTSSLANYGVYSTRMAGSRFERVRFLGFAEAGAAVGYGWVNDFWDCWFQYNGLDGLRIIETSNNVVNLIACKFGNNGRFGAFLNAGYAQSVLGCSFEQNAGSGLFLSGESHGLQVAGCGFENNAVTGWTFTNPESIQIHSDIILNGSGNPDPEIIGIGYPSMGIGIKHNFFGSDNLTDGAIYAIAAEGLGVEDNRGYSPVGDAPWLLGTNIKYFGCVKLQERGNRGFTGKLKIHNVNTNYRSNTQNEDWQLEDTPYKNYFDQSVLAQSMIVDNSNPVTVTRSTDEYSGEDVWDISSALGNTDVWGQEISIDNHPELANAHVIFVLQGKVSDAAANIMLTFDGIVVNTQSAAGTTDWVQHTLLAQLPASGTFKVGFSKIVAGVTASAQIARPVLTILGAPYVVHLLGDEPRYSDTAAPTAGTWKVGQIVWNSAPGAGGPAYWECVVAGTPGTWLAKGAPRAALQMMHPTPSGNSTSATFVDVTDANGTFNVVVPGTYLLFFRPAMYSDSTAYGRFRLIFDTGEAHEQAIGPDDQTWDCVGVTVGDTAMMMATVTLTAGSHTVKAQWKRVQGAGSMIAMLDWDLWGLAAGS
jgi:hypothetical protein